MKKGYDLIIIGNSEKSFLTAEHAATLGARVGLINPLSNYQSSLLHAYKNTCLSNDLMMSYGDIDEQRILWWQNKNCQLEKIGVELIDSHFQFINDKNLQIKTTKDTLIAPNYILNLDKIGAFDGNYHHNDNLASITIDRLIIEDQWNSLPNQIAILGNDLTAIYLAHRLQKLEKNISLFTSNKSLLPYEDDDISWQLQLHLEARGIKFYFDYNLKDDQVSLLNNQYDKLIITDINHSQINDGLGLGKVGVKLDRHRVKVNSKLQTDNQQIYACGDILGGYQIDNIAEYEAKVAVKNALFIPWHKVNYKEIPYCLVTNPHIYRIGYTEKQARLLYGDQIKVISLSPSLQSSLLNHHHNIYYLKIILDRHNHIIGFHSLGLAEEIFTAITFMVKNSQPLNYLFKLNLIQPSNSELIKIIKQRWHEQNKNINNIIMSLTETFFIWKNDYI